MLARGTAQAPGLVLAINPDLTRAATMPASALLPELGGAGALAGEDEQIGLGGTLRLPPGAAKIYRFVATPVIRRASRKTAPPTAARATRGRIAIEAVTPSVDGGQFPVKRIAGEMVEVEANLIGDGHGQLAADLLWRPADEAEWQHTPMVALGNDRYAASFPLARMGRHLFTIEAWYDPFASLLDDIAKKQQARVPVTLEIEEAVTLIRTTEGQALAALPTAPAPASLEERSEIIAKPEVATAMRAERREFLTRLASPLAVEADRPAAGFGSWYELFPAQPERRSRAARYLRRCHRTAAGDQRDGIRCAVFPPIHPIGRAIARAATTPCTPSPVIPAALTRSAATRAGTKPSIPALGTLEDFRPLRVPPPGRHRDGARFRRPMRARPSLAAQHPEWFEWRPDGSIRYAENPPKRYEDIVNVDFYAASAVPSLWLALRDIVLLWAVRACATFRVDNPHTKPLPFWEWLIGEVRAK